MADDRVAPFVQDWESCPACGEKSWSMGEPVHVRTGRAVGELTVAFRRYWVKRCGMCDVRWIEEMQSVSKAGLKENA